MRSLILSAALCAAVLALSACDRASDSKPKAATAVARSVAEPPPLPKPPPARYQRDLYSRLDDCVADWGFSGKCTPLAPDAPERAQGGAFFGPIYSNALRFESQLTARREAFEQGYVGQLDENPSNKAISSADIRS